MIDSYPWDETFRLTLLAYLLRDPQKIYDVVEPQHFSSPVLVEICRILKEICALEYEFVRIRRYIHWRCGD